VIARQIIIQRIKGWLFKQHIMLQQGFTSTEGQVGELILDPSHITKTRLLSSNGVQFILLNWI